MKLAIISDIHSNLEAFIQVIEDIDAQGATEIICLGDSIGYGPDPEAVVALLRRRDIPQVVGNHEAAVIRRADRYWFNPVARKALKKTTRLLTKETEDYIRSLPLFLKRFDCHFVHGSPPDSYRTYLFEYEDEQLPGLFAAFDTPLCFAGHTHELAIISTRKSNYYRRELHQERLVLDPDERHVINAGSVGQPRDGDNHAKYVLWTPDSRLLEVRYVDYDRETTSRKIRELGMPEQYANRLL